MQPDYSSAPRSSPHRSGGQRLTSRPVLPLNLAAKVAVGLMQVKDTVQIGLMLYSGAVIFGIIGGVGIPGLVLYGLRWRQLWRGGRRGPNLILAGLGMLHEVFWAVNFPLDGPPPDPEEEYPLDIRFQGDMLRGYYWVGAALMLLVALTSLWPPARAQSAAVETDE